LGNHGVNALIDFAAKPAQIHNVSETIPTDLALAGVMEDPAEVALRWTVK